MTERVVVDPITRIEGHLRIEAELRSLRGTLTYGLSSVVKTPEWKNRSWQFIVRWGFEI